MMDFLDRGSNQRLKWWHDMVNMSHGYLCVGPGTVLISLAAEPGGSLVGGWKTVQSGPSWTYLCAVGLHQQWDGMCCSFWCVFWIRLTPKFTFLVWICFHFILIFLFPSSTLSHRPCEQWTFYSCWIFRRNDPQTLQSGVMLLRRPSPDAQVQECDNRVQVFTLRRGKSVRGLFSKGKTLFLTTLSFILKKGGGLSLEAGYDLRLG